jgi:hypothetical protein
MKRSLSLALAGALLWLTPAQAAAPLYHRTVQIQEIATPHKSRIFARNVLAKYDFSPRQFACLRSLWENESNWRHNIRNTFPVYQNGKALHAYGIAQLLGETSHDYRVQIYRGIRYIKKRHSTPCQALAFQDRHGWY